MVKKKQKKSLLHRTKHHVRLTFVPHKKNEYRPHLIRRYGLALVIILAVTVQLGYNLTKTGSVLGRVTTVTPTALLVETNDIRTAHNVTTLVQNDKLTQAAQLKAQDMLKQQYWAHTAPDGDEPWVWLDEVGYAYIEAGENLAKNFRSSSAVAAAWLSSADHRENVLKDSYTDVGFAVVDGTLGDQPVSLVVALYGAPAEGEVAGRFVSANTASLAPAVRIGIALQSLNPAVITSLALLFIAATVAVTAQVYRRQLPKRLQKTWYKHHGAAKATGLLSVAAFIVLIYGGGQI